MGWIVTEEHLATCDISDNYQLSRHAHRQHRLSKAGNESTSRKRLPKERLAKCR
jgi:hypothetical protein